MGTNDRRPPYTNDRNRQPQPPLQGEVLPPKRAQRVDPASLGLPVKPVTDVADVRDALVVADARGCNVLAPVTELQHLPPGYQVALRVIAFPVDGAWDGRSNGLWYETDGGKVALHRPCLDQLASLAGLTWDYVKRTDDGSVPLLWSYEAAATLRAVDGQRRQVIRSRTLDLRDGSPEITDMIEAARKQNRGADSQISKARLNGAALAETKATSRVVRAALGLRGSYTKVEAARPFVFPTLVWLPDLSDPEVRRMVTAVELGIARQVYGPGAASGPVLADPSTIVDVDTGDDDDAPVAPAPRQITEQAPARDFEAELRQLERRERVPVQQAAPAPQARQASPSSPPPRDVPMAASRCCVECGAPISERVADYSRRNFNEPLCFEHQPKR